MSEFKPEEVVLNKLQENVLKLLYEAHKEGQPSLSGKDISRVLGIPLEDAAGAIQFLECVGFIEKSNAPKTVQ